MQIGSLSEPPVVLEEAESAAESEPVVENESAVEAAV